MLKIIFPLLLILVLLTLISKLRASKKLTDLEIKGKKHQLDNMGTDKYREIKNLHELRKKNIITERDFRVDKAQMLKLKIPPGTKSELLLKVSELKDCGIIKDSEFDSEKNLIIESFTEKPETEKEILMDKLSKIGNHHWGSNDATYDIVKKCLECGDIFHGSEYIECSNCHADLPSL